MSNTNPNRFGDALPPETTWPDDEGQSRGKETASPFMSMSGDFEGPLDLLLELARHHRIDLTRISMVRLAEQYLSFIARLGSVRLEIAADYLVMAAWLTYLKSRVLVAPRTAGADPAAEELSDSLAFRLRRLQAMREAAAQLMARNRLDRDVFERGAPEPLALSIHRDIRRQSLRSSEGVCRAPPARDDASVIPGEQTSGMVDQGSPGGAGAADWRHGWLGSPRCLPARLSRRAAPAAIDHRFVLLGQPRVSFARGCWK